MKKLSLYIFLCLLWCNVGVAESKSDDLTGKQLLCTYIDSYNSSINTIEGFKFVSPNNVELYGYYVFEDRFFEKQDSIKYKTSLTNIHIYFHYQYSDEAGFRSFYIDRKSLIIWSDNGEGKCKLISKNINLKEMIKKKAEKLDKIRKNKLDKIKKENKI